ncbi:MAG: DNA repair protein RadA [Gammaproteobacteria bacterium]
MAKSKYRFHCNACGAEAPKWTGQCPDCLEWNTLQEVLVEKPSANASRFKEHLAGPSQVCSLDEVDSEEDVRAATGISELDRVLGGGLVRGSVTLIGGDPGIGKSTLLLQMLSSLETHAKLSSLYVTGEESAQQVGLRGKRLGLPLAGLRILTENHLEKIMDVASKERPSVIVIDSIQTIYSDLIQSAPGSVAQVRECAAQLVRFAKQTQMSLFLVGHVTKDGSLAGPRVLEHMVDTVLYFEGDNNSRFRVVRSIKNRFGAVNELGIYAMTDKGLREVSNPSAIFLSRNDEPVPGSAVMVTREGTRPLLVEVQALVDASHLANPRRVALGLEQNRLALLLAVLHRHASLSVGDQDVFANIVGGVRVSETAVDLPLLMAIVSSLRNKPLPTDMVIFGEVGLSGEIRPVQNGVERINEASKHGFKQALIPSANSPREGVGDITVRAVKHLSEALAVLYD